MKILYNLSKADLISLGALVLSWTAIISLITNNVRLGIYLSTFSFLCDLLDGYVARSTKESSTMGKYLDVHVDVFIYLVFTNILFLFYIVDINPVTLSISAIILLCGVLRLIRFTDNGIINISNKEYYVGFPVYFPYFLVIYSYFFVRLTGKNIETLVEVLLVLLGYLMISKVKNIKTRNIAVLGVLILSVLTLNYYVHK